MAMDLLSYDPADDDYIDMELSSFTNLFSNSISSPHHPREFEFQMNSSCLEKEPSTSPADELFYKGKLLPLHLPPRLQMVEKLLENSGSAYDHHSEDTFQDFYSTPLMTNAATTPTSTTPFESCNISPAESYQVSRELNPDEYLFEYSSEVNGFIRENPKKSWTKKLKLIKQSSLGSKLKASRAYLKSLFGKSTCSDESCTKAATKVADEGTASMSKYKDTNVAPKKPFGQIHKGSSKGKVTESSSSFHRRSFSMAVKRNSTNVKSSSSSSISSGCSSSSSSLNESHSFNELQFLKRSCSSAYSEIESSIQGAIAHCKQSHSRKTLSDAGFKSLTCFEDQERAELCRG